MPTLLDVVDQRLQLGVGLGFLPQGIQDEVVLRGAGDIRLPQAPLQQPDLGLLLRHLQPLEDGEKATATSASSRCSGQNPKVGDETPQGARTLSMDAFKKLSSSSRASAREQELITTEVSVESSSSWEGRRGNGMGPGSIAAR